MNARNLYVEFYFSWKKLITSEYDEIKKLGEIWRKKNYKLSPPKFLKSVW